MENETEGHVFQLNMRETPKSESIRDWPVTVQLEESRVRKLLEYIPIFEDPDFYFGEMAHGKSIFPYPIYSQTALQFQRDVLASGLFLVIPGSRELPEVWDDLETKMDADHELLDNATLEELRICFTVIFKLEVMFPAAVFLGFKSGKILRMLQRLRQLYPFDSRQENIRANG